MFARIVTSILLLVSLSGYAQTKIDLARQVKGNLPVTNLNSGTSATSSTFWRGDGTWSATGSGTVTSVAETFTGGLISVSGSPITSSGTLALTVAGTSGGIPYFSGATTWASSAALTANRIVLGGGAGAAPTVLGSLGTTTTVLHGNAAGAPTFGAVTLTTDVTGILPVANGGTGTSTAFTQGSVVFAGASGVYSQKNANFFWDNTNNLLKVNPSLMPSNWTAAGASHAAQGGIVGASGTADQWGVSGFAYTGTGTGAQGAAAILGYAESTTADTAYAGYFEATLRAGGLHAQGIEIDIGNFRGAAGVSQSTSMVPANLSAGLWIASGGSLGAPGNDASVAIGILDNGANFLRGIVIKEGIITSGVAIGLGSGHKITWNDETAFIRGYGGATDTIELAVNNAVAATVTTGGITAATFTGALSGNATTSSSTTGNAATATLAAKSTLLDDNLSAGSHSYGFSGGNDATARTQIGYIKWTIDGGTFYSALYQ